MDAIWKFPFCFRGSALNSKQSDWDKTLSVNVVGYVNMIQACHPYMKRSKSCDTRILVSVIWRKKFTEVRLNV